jgi:hypothetical protein
MIDRNRTGSRDRSAVTAESEQPTVRATYQRLRMVGLTASEAGNLTAHLNGLPVTKGSWTLQEIERLLFLRALVEQNRITS